MKFIPHKYQKYSCEFIKEHEAAAIFLDCGLGKTVITLTALYDLLFDSFQIHKVLVIAPLRVCIQWKYEADKWDHLHKCPIRKCHSHSRYRHHHPSDDKTCN